MARRVLIGSSVADAYKLIEADALLIEKDASIDQLLQLLVENTKTRHVYVVDEKKRLLGSVRLSRMLSYLVPSVEIEGDNSTDNMERYFQFADAEIVADIMVEEVLAVTPDRAIVDVLRIMREAQVNEIPVVNDEQIVIGEINLVEIVQHYLQAKVPQKEA